MKNSTETISKEEAEKIVRNFVGAFQNNSFGNGVLSMGTIHYGNSVRYGEQIRDSLLHKYSILPGAVQTFISVASSRQWHVLGKPRSASRSLEMLQNSFFVDRMGITHPGFEQMVSRMCMDWLAIGRCMFYSKPINGTKSPTWEPYEYIDPARIDIITKGKSKTQWLYANPSNNKNRKILQNHMFFMDSVRNESCSFKETIPFIGIFWIR